MKKTFKDNPALQFISGAADPEEPETEKDTGAAPTVNAAEDLEDLRRHAPEGYKVDPRLIEKRTHRLQVVLQPSLYKKVKAAAKAKKVSVNDYIHRLLEQAVKEENNTERK